MTIEEAIKILEYPVKKWSMEWDEREDGLSYYEALDMAISALRQQEHFRDLTKKVEPLTLDELRKMDGEPVWVVCLKPERYYEPPIGWRIIEKSIVGTFGVWNDSSCLAERDYGKTWLAYRHKPEEDDHDERKENENV